MFLIQADLINEDSEKDTIIIGLFSTIEKSIDAARNWVKKEREDGLEEDICLYGWKFNVDSDVVGRLDLLNDKESKDFIKKCRLIEKEFEFKEDED